MKSVLNPLRVGIVGCNGYAFEMIKRILTLPRWIAPVAATDLDCSSAGARFCEGQGIRLFPDFDSLLAFAPGNLDGIYIPVPIHLHEPMTCRCLEAGMPVWLEKPPAATVEEVDRMMAVSDRTGLRVDVCFNSIYSCETQQLKAELLSGRYGRIQRIRGLAGWSRPDAYFARSSWAGRLQKDGRWILDGTLNNPLAHLVCNNLYFAATEHHALAEAVSVEARLFRANPGIESEDTSAVRIITAEGIEILSHLTLCPEEEIPAITVIDTERAVITFREFNEMEIAWRDGRSERRESYTEHRIQMLQELSIRARSGEPPLCPLSMCRPFTHVVESAFRQVLERDGCIPAIPEKRLNRVRRAEQTVVQIRGINRQFETAHRDGVLFAGMPGME